MSHVVIQPSAWRVMRSVARFTFVAMSALRDGRGFAAIQIAGRGFVTGRGSLMMSLNE